MTKRMIVRRWWRGAALWASGMLAAQLQAGEPVVAGAGYIRAQSFDKGRMELQTAVRRLVPVSGAGPEILLVAVTHIGEAEYYARLQKILDGSGRVLFEGVGTPSFMKGERPADGQKANWTGDQLDYLGETALWFRSAHHRWPTNMVELTAAVTGEKPRERRWIQQAQRDAWGRPIGFEPKGDDLRVVSFGADGREGGEGEAKDLSNTLKPGDAEKANEISNLQQKMADMIGLKYQMTSIDYDRDHFVNSDLGMEEIAQELKKVTSPNDQNGTNRVSRSANARMLASMLSGNGDAGGAVEMIQKMFGSTAAGRQLLRVIMADTLSMAEDLMSKGMPDPGMDKLMRVLIDRRNEKVASDLRACLAEKKPPRSVAVFYGGGHMKHLENILCRDLGYRVADNEWLRSFEADPATAGMPPAQVEMIRGMLRMAIDANLSRPAAKPVKPVLKPTPAAT